MFVGLGVVVMLEAFRRYPACSLGGPTGRASSLLRLGLPIAGIPASRTICQRGGLADGPDRRGLAGSTCHAVQIASISFMVPFGLNQAVTVRVSRPWRRQSEGVRAPLDRLCHRRLHGVDGAEMILWPHL